MKKVILNFFFISMLVGREKESNNYLEKSEIVIRIGGSC